MFQSLYYDYLTYEYHLRDDIEGWSTFKHKPTLYIESKNGEYETLDGKKVAIANKISDWKNPKYYEKDVDKLTRVLVDFYHETDEVPSFHNLLYIDIECEIGGALTEESVQAASTKVTSISLYDNNIKKYICLILDESGQILDSDKDGREIISCIDEKDLLKKFLNKWRKIDPTIISGWNSEFFDMPYLYHRIKNVLGEDYALKLSPIGKVKVHDLKEDKKFSRSPKFESYIDIGGINHFDYMFLFKKYIMKEEPSYKLGDVGEKYVELGKIEYNGSLDKLFREDPKKFIDYNIRDVEILVELEKKFQFIDLAVMMCHICHTSYKDIYWSTKLNEGAILTYLKRRDIVSPNKPTTYDPSLRDIDYKEAYAGGYLLDPTPGLYDWLIDSDYSSLYPSIIRSLNLGIETYLGQILDRQDKFDCWWGLDDLKAKDPKQIITLEDKSRKRKEISIGDLVEIIEGNKYTIAASGAIFRTDKLSITAEILGDWFAMRKEVKKDMKAAYKSGNQDLGDHYNRKQHSLKILLNSLYGNYAITGWRYSDGRKILSQAITLSGQRMIKESIKDANKWMDEQLAK